MSFKISSIQFLLVCIGITFFLTCTINFFTKFDNCNCENEKEIKQIISNPYTNFKPMSPHKLAVLVPFRDRFEELLEFVPYISTFLFKQNIAHHIFILNQVDSYRFNRASLINVGFLETLKDYDYIAMHDVDLLPLNSNLSYKYPEKGPHHVAAPSYHPKYHYATFVGGILLIKREHFVLVKGMSNQYWGWGLEDDEFYVRIKEASLSITRPENLTTGTTNTFRHVHKAEHRKRDTAKCFNQREVTRKRDRKTGLHDVQYQVVDRKKITIEDFSITVLNIKLSCNKSLTPWCECPDNKSNAKKPVKTNSDMTK